MKIISIMFEKKLKNTTRGGEDGQMEESASNPELIQILKSLNNNVMRLAMILATTADSNNQNKGDVDSPKSVNNEPDQSSPGDYT